MPLLDHFHPPLYEERHWESFHAAWASYLAEDLNRRLPEHYFAEELTHAGAIVEIDVGTFEGSRHAREADGSATATLPPQIWSPPAAAFTIPAVFADDFEVRVISTESGPTLVAAIELVSPRNKDRAEARRAFAIKCASYLHQGISLIVIDIVTNRRANLHTQIMELLNVTGSSHLPADAMLYAVAYQPLRRQKREEVDLWPVPLAVGGTLPLLPLALNAELYMPVDLEATYMNTRIRRRLA
ncbi:MAG TPA: DUF4058 family protein [Gemmataceae bacterium]|jgi:hypothetical protein